MLIFIREGEQSKIDNINLSNAGFVRRNHLPTFLIKKKNPKINIPEIIVTSKQNNKNNTPYQSVAMLAIELNKKIENNFNDINEVVDFLIKNIDKDILICWKYNELNQIVENVIYKLFKLRQKLSWGKNPLSKKPQSDNYNSLWVLNNNFLYVFNQYDVVYNYKHQSYEIDYLNFQVQPLFSKQLSSSIFYRFIDRIRIF